MIIDIILKAVIEILPAAILLIIIDFFIIQQIFKFKIKGK